MFIVNPEEQDLSKLYSCNGLIATELIYTHKLPLYGKGLKGENYFAKTDALLKALENLPFWMHIFIHLEKKDVKKGG